MNEDQRDPLDSELSTGSQKVRPHGFSFSDRKLLLCSAMAFVLALHGWATIRFGWPRLLAIFPLSAGCIAYPTLFYVTVRTATERRLSIRLSLAIVASLTALALWLLSLYVAGHPYGRNAQQSAAL